MKKCVNLRATINPETGECRVVKIEKSAVSDLGHWIVAISMVARCAIEQEGIHKKCLIDLIVKDLRYLLE